jgi:uncharacterized protein (DUF1800 family)
LSFTGALKIALAALVLGGLSLPAQAQNFRRGDSNDDGVLDISDGIATLNWLFRGNFNAGCLDALDANDVGGIDLTDGIFVFNFLFRANSVAPPAPGHVNCGVDPTPDALDCATYNHCVQDSTPPVISGLRVTSITQTSADVVFATDEPATTRVDFGLTVAYGMSVSDPSLTEVHVVQLQGLTPGSTYHFSVTATDEFGNRRVTPDGTFGTLPVETDLTDIGHVLNRVAYGPSAADIDRLETIGVEAYIEEQLDPASIDESTNTALNTRVDALFENRVLANDRRLVNRGEVWRYFKGTVEPPAAWKNEGFDDTSWLIGPTGIGYGDGDDLTELTDMQGNYLSVYLRKTFSVADLGAIDALVLRVDYDDGFAAFINGTEVVRIGLTGTPGTAIPFNRLATSHDAGTPEDIDISAHIPRLHVGVNTLAIQVHNTTLTSSDLSMIPELINREVLPGPPLRLIRGVTQLQSLPHLRGVYSRRQLQAVLAEFWENHFTTDTEKVRDYFDALLNSDATDAMTTAQAEQEAAQVDFIEYQFYYDNALGNFGNMLLYSATAPSMLIYLDNVLNLRAEPNENYAREILELSAFGVDNRYVQRDIEQLAKAFTGWTVCKVDRGEAQSFPASSRMPPTDCGVQFTDSVFLGLGAGWTYFKGTAEPSPGPGGEATTAWTAVDFDDSTWLNGSTGIGYGDGDDATVLADMQGNYVSVYIRREFTVADPFAQFDNLILATTYDDGYVAYLNGVEVARSATLDDDGNPPTFDELADETREIEAGDEFVNLNRFRGLLRPAPQTNVLAIQVHNNALNSSDLSMRPRLLDRTILPGSIENGDPTGVWTFRFDPNQHDTTNKTLFQGTAFQINVTGRTGAAGVLEAIDVIDRMANHPSTIEFISIKLIQKFVSDQITLPQWILYRNPATRAQANIPSELVELLSDMTAEWLRTNGNIGAVMRVLLDPQNQASAFWSDVAYRAKVRTPIEYINASLRILEASADGDDLPGLNLNMGMNLFTRDEPDGWSELGFDWMDTSSMRERINFAQTLTENTDGGSDYSWNTLGYLDSRGLDTADEIVDFFAAVMFHGTLSSANRSLLLEFLNTDYNGNALPFNRSRSDFRMRVQELIGLMLSMPQWQFQ